MSDEEDDRSGNTEPYAEDDELIVAEPPKTKPNFVSQAKSSSPGKPLNTKPTNRVNPVPEKPKKEKAKHDKKKTETSAERLYRMKSEKAKAKKEPEPESSSSESETEDSDSGQDESFRYPTLTYEDVHTCTMYVLPRPSVIYVVSREPETAREYGKQEDPSSCWTNVGAFFFEDEARKFCEESNRRAFSEGKHRGPVPERGYCYWQLPVGPTDPLVAEDLVSRAAERIDRARQEAIKKQNRNRTTDRYGYKRK